MKKQKNDTVLVLDSIRSVYNVGAIFRTADGAGVSRIILTGHTPTPIDRFGRIRADFHKSALGAETSIPWEESKNLIKTLKSLKTQGYSIIGVEQSVDSLDYRKIRIPNKHRVFVVGNEVSGVRKEILKLCDETVELPMLGQKESLNVSVATGIILYHFLKS